MDIFVGAAARRGQPTRVEYRRRHISGLIQRANGARIARWMRRPHAVKVGQLSIHVPVGVFPPKFFFSTRMLCKLLATSRLDGVEFLEVGSGSGAVSLTAAKSGARVTAVDISAAAVDATLLNARTNGLDVTVYRSDMFDALDGRTFDFVVINPPYFQHDPESELDHAFHAGAGFEYFHRLFADLAGHLSPGGKVWVTLAEGCDATIADIAARHGWRFDLHSSSCRQLQWTYLFSLHHNQPSTSL